MASSGSDKLTAGNLVVHAQALSPNTGQHMMLGYWNKPEATAETLKDSWLHTGDLCTVDEDGFITICDRMKDMIISGSQSYA